MHVKKGSKPGRDEYRPTTDRAKESLFNTLNNLIDFDSVKCLDLFAGSGSLGFEALSRGAASCDFVDISARHLMEIQKTAEQLKISENINLVNSSASDYLDENTGSYFDLIFADPPYNYGNYGELLKKIFLLKFSLLVLEHSAGLSVLYDTNKYEMLSKSTGSTYFKIFNSKD